MFTTWKAEPRVQASPPTSPTSQISLESSPEQNRTTRNYGRTRSGTAGSSIAHAPLVNHAGGGSVESCSSSIRSGDGWREAGDGHSASRGLGILNTDEGSRVELLLPSQDLNHNSFVSGAYSDYPQYPSYSSSTSRGAYSAYSPTSPSPSSASYAYPSSIPSRYGSAHRRTASLTAGSSAGSLAPTLAERFEPANWDLSLLSSGEKESDDWLHELKPGEVENKVGDGRRGGTVFTKRGMANVGCLILLGLGLFMLFAGYPIIAEVQKQTLKVNGAFNLGGINGSGQVPATISQFGLIDPATPETAYTRTGLTGSNDGTQFELVFSDEFDVDGRSFFPGDDPYWTAVDLHYWGTNNLEWYDPRAVTTANGTLRLTLSRADDPSKNHNLNYTGGMISTWNQFCFTGGYIEASVRLPGSPKYAGLWPAVWTMGNLGRAGYGGSLDGMWPYTTYDSCDVGTLPNQTYKATGQAATPQAALDTGDQTNYNGELSYLPGMRLSACTCPNELGHPGPKKNGKWVGRSAPEIDIIEAQVDWGTATGHVSMSLQAAPFNAYYQFENTSTSDFTVYDPAKTSLNSYIGGITQQSVSGIVKTNQNCYEHPATGKGTGCFDTYGFEYKAGEYITWTVSDEPAWTIFQTALKPDALTEVGERTIPGEPLYILCNLAISENFGAIDWDHLNPLFPFTMEVDYIRVYQPAGERNIGCSPPDFPTKEYIDDRLNLYTNPNITTFEQGGYTNPLSSLVLKQTGESC